MTYHLTRIPAAAIRRAWSDETRPVAELAADLGLKRVQLRRRAKALGMPVRKPGRIRTVITDDHFGPMWCFGVSTRAMGDHYGCTDKHVGKIARRLGLPPRKEGGDKPAVSVAMWREWELSNRMAHEAQRTRFQMRAAEMVDRIGNRVA